jgi:hypothetical protein
MPAAEAVAKAKSEKDLQEIKNSSKQLDAFERELSAFDKIDAVKNSGREFKNVDDIAVLYEFVKTLDPNSAVREGEVKLSQSAIPALAGLGYKMEALVTSKNKIITPEVRRDIFKTIDTLKQGAVQGIKPELQRIASVANDQGVPLKHILKEPLLKILWGTSAESAPASTAPMRSPSDPGYVAPPNGLPVQGAQQGYIWRWNGIDKFVKTGKAS